MVDSLKVCESEVVSVSTMKKIIEYPFSYSMKYHMIEIIITYSQLLNLIPFCQIEETMYLVIQKGVFV